MTVALSANALTLLATVKTDLGIAVATYDDQLTRLINAASDAIARYCSRTFQRSTAIVEKSAGYGLHKLRLKRTPINELISVTFDGEAVDSTEYEIGDAEAGLVNNEGGWVWTAHMPRAISDGALSGTEELLYEITYDGGWVTPNQSKLMSGTPTLTFAATSPATITRSAGSWLTDGFAANLPVTITGAVTAANNGAFRVASVSALVLTLASGETLTAEGPTAACTAEIVRGLPWDLEDACIELARALYLGKQRNPDVASEHLMSWGATYGAAGGELPPTVARVLSRYRRLET